MSHASGQTAVHARAAPVAQRTVVVPSRPAPRSLLRPRLPSHASAVQPSRSRRGPPAGTRRVRPRMDPEAVARLAARCVAFYALTAFLIVAGVAAHEYAHYSAHEGFGVPALAYSPSVAQAQDELLSVHRAAGAGGEAVLLEQPERTTIVVFPNTLVQAAGLGLLPAQAYSDDGVLASTYFRLDDGQAQDLRSRGGTMPAAVVAAPLWLAVGVFFAAAAWACWRPNLFNKALLVAYAVQLGDAGHHAEALGMPPALFYAASTLAIVAAAALVALRMNSRSSRPAPTASGRALPGPPPGWPGGPSRRSTFADLSVRRATDKRANRAVAQRLPARLPVTLP